MCVPVESVCRALAAKPADGKTGKIFESRAAAFRFLRRTERSQSAAERNSRFTSEPLLYGQTHTQLTHRPTVRTKHNQTELSDDANGYS